MSIRNGPRIQITRKRIYIKINSKELDVTSVKGFKSEKGTEQIPEMTERDMETLTIESDVLTPFSLWNI